MKVNAKAKAKVFLFQVNAVSEVLNEMTKYFQKQYSFYSKKIKKKKTK